MKMYKVFKNQCDYIVSNSTLYILAAMAVKINFEQLFW